LEISEGVLKSFCRNIWAVFELLTTDKF
jgi:hypothetical protein